MSWEQLKSGWLYGAILLIVASAGATYSVILAVRIEPLRDVIAKQGVEVARQEKEIARQEKEIERLRGLIKKSSETASPVPSSPSEPSEPVSTRLALDGSLTAAAEIPNALLVTQTVGTVELGFYSCEVSGSTATCNVSAVNNGADTYFRIYLRESRAFDSKGFETRPSSIRLAEFDAYTEQHEWVQKRLITGIPISGKIVFKGISSTPTAFVLLELRCMVGDSWQTIEVRDIPLRRG